MWRPHVEMPVVMMVNVKIVVVVVVIIVCLVTVPWRQPTYSLDEVQRDEFRRGIDE